MVLLLWLGQAREQPAAATGKLDAALATTLTALPPEETVRFIVHLTEQPLLAEEALPLEKVARRQAVVVQLQDFAAASQTSLLHELAHQQTQGNVTSIQPLWIINAVIVEGNAAAVSSLSARSDIASIRLDVAQQYLSEPTEVFTSTAPTGFTWGVEQVMAPHAWHGLGVNGAGVVIAIMDTGVDWQHPALASNYRGNQGGTADHSGNWYDPVDNSLEPIDPHNHGTHVAGTAVGQLGIGVAPGAQWIGVRMLNSYGQGFPSEIHLAFQWLLAPAGNPALAPDVVNASWSSGDATDTTYQADIQMLHAAGIIPVFAAGNNGPDTGSVGSPASLPDVLAVGATDSRGVVTWFSSQGPSPMTNEIKPDVVAPGGGILSSLPGGDYGLYSGTSMATPHVAGAAALLLSANPQLTPSQVRQLLRDTAIPADPPHPNHQSGYGHLDASALVATQISHGTLTGTILQLIPEAPLITQAAITLTTASGVHLRLSVDDNHHFQALLRPGVYQLTMTAYGYTPLMVSGVLIRAGVPTQRNLAPVALPFARVSGGVWNAQGQPLVTTVQVEGTPLQVMSGSDGRYDISLPYGVHLLVAAANGYKRTTLYFNVNNPAGHQGSFILYSRPTILLVNDGLWHYQDFSTYYEQSLDAARYSYDTHYIYSPFDGAPTAEQLQAYDIVIWASPGYSPATVQGGDALVSYLEEGGKLLVFGPNVALFDGNGIAPHSWWYDYLRGRWVDRQSAPFALTGSPDTLFEGLSFNLNGVGSADNQQLTDEVAPQPHSLTQSVLTYADGSAAALQAGLCEPYNIVYLGFGLEGVSPATVRPQLVERSLNWLVAPPNPAGIQLAPGQVDSLAVPGSTYAYTFTLYNISETITDTFSLSIEGASWNSSILTPTLTLGPCQAGETVVYLTVPANLSANIHHSMTLQAVSQNTPTISQQATIHHKTPGHILFVDDDRFFDSQETLLNTLNANGLTYDVWSTSGASSATTSLPTGILPYYDLVLWYTGYDWFAPITSSEGQAIEQYLAQGGRLLLTSQDYLYYHHNTSLTQNYFGVQSYYGEAEPTLIVSAGSIRQAGLYLPLPLDVSPYQNFGDGLILASGEPVMWQNSGLPGAVANQGLAANGRQWRTMFWSFPLEKLPASAQNMAMNGIVGWLSDLGNSTWVVDEAYSPLGGANRVFTMTIRNEGVESHAVTVVNSLPKFLDIDLSSVTGGATYNPITRQLTWQGVMAAGEVKEIRYSAAADPTLPAGTRLNNQLSLQVAGQDFIWRQSIPLWVGVPDLRGSTLTISPAEPTRDQPITYTLTLHNQSNLPAPAISSTLFLPLPLVPITDTMVSSSGVITLTQAGLQWQGGLAPGETVTMSLVLTATVGVETQWLSAAALIADGFTDPFLITHQIPLMAPYQVYLPWLPRSP
jgi:uncharacterized repeat protein (TIGR01451 family)